VLPDYYAVLGVRRDASADEIKAARRARLRATHPDANPGDPGAAERFHLVHQAAEVLTDPRLRREYDRAAAPPDLTTCYEMLGIAPDASGAQISERYRQLVREAGKPVPERLKAAYRRIGDPRRRAGYDRGLGAVTRGLLDDIDVHVPPHTASEGAAVYTFALPDRELCPQCDGLGRIMLPCAQCDGRGYWRRSTIECEVCNGRRTDERACFQCRLSGWVEVTRTVRGHIPPAARENLRITVRDDLLGVVTLRLRFAGTGGTL
jgi:molecular chaperone DnaJ